MVESGVGVRDAHVNFAPTSESGEEAQDPIGLHRVYHGSETAGNQRGFWARRKPLDFEGTRGAPPNFVFEFNPDD